MHQPNAGGGEDEVVMARQGMRGFSPAKLRRRRSDARFTLEQLALLSGVGQQTLSAWEAGKSEPTPHKLAAVAVALRVTIMDFSAIPDDDMQLADLRFLRGQTQADVAKALGIAVSAVSRMERAIKPPTDDQLDILARLYGVDRSALQQVWIRTRDRVAGGLRSR
jgi:transcriptional regulator with XRE-family HTH domain